jgi:uncharacterized protein
MRCPTCKATFQKKDGSTSYPFCSTRCQLVDLGRWLGEDYRVPDHDTPVEIPTDDTSKPNTR